MFDLEIEKILDWINDRGFASVALQLPEGLKLRATELTSSILSNTSAEPIVLGYPCYGACDLFIDYRRYAEALVHFGHSSIPSMGTDENVLYIEAHTDIDISDAVGRIADSLPDRVGLLSTVQYTEMLPVARSVLESHGKQVFIGKGDSRICYPGQVLGCNCTSAVAVADKVDSFLYIGEGDFHPLAVAFGSEVSMDILNPVTGELRNVNDVRDRILRKRFAVIQNAKKAQTFTVIICGKVGQDRYNIAKGICSRLRDNGRDAYLAVMDEISPQSLLPFRADAFVCTGCPRVAMDDSVRYDRPMITVTEVDQVLGLEEWDDYRFDQILANDCAR